MLAEMTTSADLSNIQDQIATAQVGDGDRLLDICTAIVEVLKELNSRIGDLEYEQMGE